MSDAAELDGFRVLLHNYFRQVITLLIDGCYNYFREIREVQKYLHPQRHLQLIGSTEENRSCTEHETE